MSKARFFDTFLRVLLSVALVASFTPIVPRESYASSLQSEEDLPAVQVEGEDLGSVVDSSAGSKGLGNALSDSSSLKNGSGVNGDSAEESLNASQAASNSSSDGDAASALNQSADSHLGLAQAGSEGAQADAREGNAPVQTPTCPYVKIMASGYAYECDYWGHVFVDIDEAHPEVGSVDYANYEFIIFDEAVTSIPDYLCFSSEMLERVRFDCENLESIGEGAFQDCSKLFAVEFSHKNVGSIGENAFARCEKLETLSFSGMSIGSIGAHAFADCSSLKSLDISETATILSMGVGCFESSGLVATGLDRVSGLTAIPDEAYRYCRSLADTGLGFNQEIETVGALSFSYCDSLLATGLETNTTVRELKSSCFFKSELTGGLVLPRNSKIEVLPDKAFYESNLSYVRFNCDHAILIDSDSFPQRNMTVYVPAGLMDLYQDRHVELNWESCNGIGPVATEDPVSAISVTCDPDKLTYQVGDTISLDGLRVSIAFESGTRELAFSDIENNPAIRSNFSCEPADGDLFEASMDGLYLQLRYSDGKGQCEARSSQPLAGENLPPATPSTIRYAQVVDTGGRTLMEGVEIPAESGSITVNPGDSIKLDSAELGMLDDDISFSDWRNRETGEILSHDAVYAFTPTADMDIEARFVLKSKAVHVNEARSTDASDSYAHLSVLASNCYRNAGEAVSLSAASENAHFLGWYVGSESESYVVSDQLAFDYVVEDSGDENSFSQIEITPWYCAEQASVVLGVAGIDKEGNPPGQFVSSGLYGIGSQVTVNAIPEPGYVFDYATDASGAVVGATSAGSYTFLLTESTELVAHFREAKDDKEAFEALQAALIATLGTLAVIGTMYGLGELVDPIAFAAIGEISEAETVEELVEIGGKAIQEIEDILNNHRHDNDPDHPKGDHKIEVTAIANPEAGGIVRGGGVHYEGSTVKLEAVANPGYKFVCWKENGVERATTNLFTFAVTKATPEVVAMTAVFERETPFTISVDAEPAESAEILCNGVPVEGGAVHAAEGDILTFTARPSVLSDESGKTYKLVEWRETDAQGVTIANHSEVCEYRVSGNARIVAVMDGQDEHTVHAKADPPEGGKVLLRNGETTGETLRVSEGESITAEATAEEGCLFDGWYVANGAEDVAPTLVSCEPKCTYVPVTDCTLTARFTHMDKVSVVVDPVDSLAGKCTVTGDGYCISGEPVVLSVELSKEVQDELTFKGWFREGSEVPMGIDPAHLEFVPEGDTTIRAVYIPHRYTIGVKTKSHLVERGTVAIEGYPAGTDKVLAGYGESVTIKATPCEGFRFLYWKDGHGKKHPEATLSVRVTENETYTAVFAGAEPEVVIAADSWNGGTVTCNGHEVTPTTDEFSLGETLHLKAQAKKGYLFWGWYVNGFFVSLDEEYTMQAKGLTNDSKRCVVTAAFKPYDILCVPLASPSNGGSVRASRVITERGSEIALKAQPAAGYAFAGWCSITGQVESLDPEFSCRQMMSHVHIAHFEPCSYNVSATVVVAGEDGSFAESDAAGWVEGAGDVGAGASVSLSAHALPGYSFQYWIDAEGNVISESKDYHFVPSSNTSLRAVFQAKQYTVSASADETCGAVIGAGTYSAGEEACVRAVAYAGASFVGWFDAGICVSTDSEYRFSVTKDVDLEAVFGSGSYTVSTVASPVEAGYTSGFGGFDAGQRTTLSATAKPGFTFDCWRDSEGNVVSGLSECIVEVAGNASYTACFTRNTYSVSLSSNVEGVGTLTGGGIYEFGQTIELDAQPSNEKRFAGWYLIDEDGAKTLIGDDSHCWLELDEALVSQLDSNVLELEAQFADPYSVSVFAHAVVEGKKLNKRCRATGGGIYSDGDSVTLTATTGIGYRFVGWSADEEGRVIVETSETLSFTAQKDVTYYAQFAADPESQVSVNVTQSSILRGKAFLVGDHGLTSVTKTCDKGDAFVAVAIPWSTYHFSHWINDAGAIISYNAVYVGVAQQDMQLTAVFYDAGFDIQVGTYPTEAGFSMVVPTTGDGYLTATWLVSIPFAGWKFCYWIDERGCPVGFSPLIVRPATANKTYMAYYVRDAWNILAIDPREGGHVEGSEGHDLWGFAYGCSVENGTSVTLKAVPDVGYAFDGWYRVGDGSLIEGDPVSTEANWTFVPQEDVVVAARFAPVPTYSVTATAVNGTVDPASSSVESGDSVTFTASPNDGCYLESATIADASAEGEEGTDGQMAGQAIECDISDYEGGQYELSVSDVAGPKEVTFNFAVAGQPVLNAQPESVSVHPCKSFSLSVDADASSDVLAHEAFSSGAAASHRLSYQWYFAANGSDQAVALDGETAATLTRDAASSADEGFYYCRITQEYLGTVTFVDTDPVTVSVAPYDELVFNGGVLPAATAHVFYKQLLEPATGGSGAYSYAVAEGSSLPEGMSLVSATRDGLTPCIGGISNEVGTYRFGIECTDIESGQKETANYLLVVKPLQVNMEFEQDAFTFNGSPQCPELNGVPEGLGESVSYSYVGVGSTHYSGSNAPIEAGAYRVVASLNSDGYCGHAATQFVIEKAKVQFDISVADAVYDGDSHEAQVCAKVEGQAIDRDSYCVTYRGTGSTVYGPSAQAPSDSGTYEVAASVCNPNYTGEASAPFVIDKAPQSITGTTSYTGVYGGNPILLNNDAKTPVSFEVVNSDVEESPVSLDGRCLAIRAAGTAQVIARAPESRNYQAAEDVVLTVSVAPAQLLVVVDDAQRVEGEANPEFSSSLVSRACTENVAVAYTCDADEGSPEGEYPINATVDDSNFAATVRPGMLTVTQKAPEPDNPEPGPGPVDPDNPDPDNPQPGPDPDNPEPDPDPDPDPDNPGPGPVDPDPDNPQPEPGPDNPDPDNPQPGPDPDNPEPGPNPDNPDPDNPQPDPDNPDPSNPEPGPEPEKPEPGGSDPEDPSTPGSDEPENPGGSLNPANPEVPSGSDTDGVGWQPAISEASTSEQDASENSDSVRTDAGKTGDTSARAVFVALGALAVSAVACVVACRKRRNHRYWR